jgi:hypothetical protein
LITPKGIIRFFCLFLLVFGLLLAPWPGVGRAYTIFYSKGASFLFGSIGATGAAQFEPLNDSEYHLRVILFNRTRRTADGDILRIRTRHNSRHAGYIYVAFLIALIMGTPIPARRKAWALFWGIILIHGLVALKLGLRIFHTFNNKPLSLFSLNPFCSRVLSITHQVFAVNATFGFIVCVFIWILVSFRRRDWERIQNDSR